MGAGLRGGTLDMTDAVSFRSSQRQWSLAVLFGRSTFQRSPLRSITSADVSVSCLLKLLTDGALNRLVTGSSISRAALIAAIRRIADSESPPMSKNDSSTPTRSTLRVCAKMSDRSRST